MKGIGLEGVNELAEKIEHGLIELGVQGAPGTAVKFLVVQIGVLGGSVWNFLEFRMGFEESVRRQFPGLVAQTVDLGDDLDAVVMTGLHQLSYLILGPTAEF